jgi:hypothetical protein
MKCNQRPQYNHYVTWWVILHSAEGSRTICRVYSQWRTGGGGFNFPHPRNSEVLTKQSQIPSSVEKCIRNNQIRIRGSLICKMSVTPFSLPCVLDWFFLNLPPPTNKIPGYASIYSCFILLQRLTLAAVNNECTNSQRKLLELLKLSSHTNHRIASLQTLLEVFICFVKFEQSGVTNMVSLEFYINIIFPAARWPWGRLSL